MTKLPRPRQFTHALIATLLLFAGSLATAQGVADQRPPDGFETMLVYMGTGVFDATDPDYTMPDGDVWHREIMGRSDAEITENRAEAVAFFERRFGLNPDAQDGLMLVDFMVDPRNEYRAYVSSEIAIPSEGWVVRDGGWMLAVTDPEGIALGGEFESTHVPQGALFVFGDYNIDVPGTEPIIVHYQSGQPIVATASGMMFLCETYHPDWGWGRAQGISAPATLEDGRTQANIRNVLTFSGLGDPDRVPNAHD